MIRERLYRENHRALFGVRRRKTAATILGRGRRGAEQAGAGGVGVARRRNRSSLSPLPIRM